MVILIYVDGLLIFIVVEVHVKPVMEEVCLWPPQ